MSSTYLAEENVYYKDNLIKITDKWAIFGQRVYNMEDISSAGYEINPADKTAAWKAVTRTSFVLGSIGLLFLMWKWFLVPDTNRYEDFALGIAVIFFAALSLLTLALLPVVAPARYLVTIEGRFGKANVLLAKHWSYANKVSLCLNRAIKAHKKNTASELAPGRLGK